MEVHDHKYIESVKRELGNKSLDELTREERLRLQQVLLHEKHHGHESMHAEMAFILVVGLILTQLALVRWKNRHYSSYRKATLIGMWLVPLIISIRNKAWRFIGVWAVYSLITALVVKRSLKKPLAPSTPRLVYKWFYLIHKVTSALGLVGYAILVGTFLGINILFDIKIRTAVDFGGLLLFYGLYFGVLGSDTAEICSDIMASHIGYYQAEGMPTRSLARDVCAVCGNKLLVDINEAGIIESTYKLTCGHVFHEFCIRGWCIVGKKQTCPYCKEKVDLKKMFCNPWEKPHIFYGKIIDWIRWLIAWQPLLIFVIQTIVWYLGLE